MVSPHVSSIPYSGLEEKGVEESPELFTACAVTLAVSRAAQGRSPIGKKDTLEGLADTFLCDNNEGGSLSATDPVVEDPLYKSTGEIKEAGERVSLSHVALIAEQERDSEEIICLGHQPLDEKEAVVYVVPCC